MTPVPSRLTADEFESALRDAQNADPFGSPRAGLDAPTIGSIVGRVEEAWDHVQEALRDAYRGGRAAVEGAIAKANAAIDHAAQEVAALASEVRAGIRLKIEAFLESITDRALARVRGSIVLGGRTLELRSVEIAQRISIGGQLGLSLTEACILAAEGELTVNASYSAADAR